jgi:glycosyltransferase involved in cell wall biosynthesis
MVKISVLTSLYNCKNYLSGFFAAIEQIVNKEECEFLLLHNAPQKEEIEIIDKNILGKTWFRHIIIAHRENLYATWNRGINLSIGKYVTVWNVDDVRFPNSILLQKNALDNNPQAAIAYGDIFGSSIYGQRGTKFYQSPEWKGNEKEFYRGYFMSCFQMWRKSIHDKLGYYDEQFKCVGDFDFQIRAALHFPFVKVNQPLGIYLENQPQKISNSNLHPIENNVVFRRYGVYEQIDFTYYYSSLSLYNRKQLLFFGQTHAFQIKSPFSIAYKSIGLIKSLICFPFHLLRSLKKHLQRLV